MRYPSPMPSMRDNDLSSASDETLVERARAGSEPAFAELWRRHHGAVLAATRSFTGFEAEDIAQEAFAKVFAQLRRGAGPDTAFRAYLARTARNIAIDMSRREGDVRFSDADETELTSHATPDHADGVLTGMTTMRAFSSLPTRWQEVLWYRDVEDLPVKECARYVGMSENSATVLLKRAREGLKQAWIAAHLDAGDAASSECVWVVERLPRFTRGKSTTGDATRIRAHLDGCEACASMAEESSHLHRRLALLFLPALLLGGAPEYLRWIGTGQNRAVAMRQSGARDIVVRARRARLGSVARGTVTIAAATALTLAMSAPAPFPAPDSAAATAAARHASTDATQPPEDVPAPAPTELPATDAGDAEWAEGAADVARTVRSPVPSGWESGHTAPEALPAPPATGAPATGAPVPAPAPDGDSGEGVPDAPRHGGRR